MPAFLFDAHKGDPVVGGLIVAALLVIWLIAYLADRGARPHIPCPRCLGTSKVASIFRPEAFGTCPRCSGDGHVGRGW